jgi:hypothetical protein
LLALDAVNPTPVITTLSQFIAPWVMIIRKIERKIISFSELIEENPMIKNRAVAEVVNCSELW